MFEAEDFPLKKEIDDILNNKTDDPKFIENTVSALFFHKSQGDEVDKQPLSNKALQELTRIGKSTPRLVCQYPFHPHDMVWVCRTCQKDETCVLCNECFKQTKHDGHDVLFYFTNTGGCCDCGDETAWDPNNFCPNHGREVIDPLIYFPPPLIASMRKVLKCCVSSILQIASEIEKSFINQPNNLKIDLEEDFFLVLYKTDLYDQEKLKTKLQIPELELSEESLHVIVYSVFNQGQAVIAGPSKFSSIETKFTLIQQENLFIALQSESLMNRIEKSIKLIDFLQKISSICDGYNRLICECFASSVSTEGFYNIENMNIHDQSETYFVALFKLSLTFKIDLAHSFNHLCLALMADQKYKMEIARTYAKSFEYTTLKYNEWLGLAEESIFGLSVQFLNREKFVLGICEQIDLLGVILRVLKDVLYSRLKQYPDGLITLDPNDPILEKGRYQQLISDLKSILSIKQICEDFMLHDDRISQWLQILELVQGMHQQTRVLDFHVEFESHEFFSAFTLNISLQSLFLDTATPFICLEADNQTAVTLFRRIMGKTIDRQWEIYKQLKGSVLSQQIHPEVLINYSQYTFHHILHRTLTIVLNNIVSVERLEDAFEEILEHCKNMNFTVLIRCLLDPIVRAKAFAAQIKAGLWKRNGEGMITQMVTYSYPIFSRFFCDQDLLFLQFCGLLVGAQTLMERLSDQFFIYDWAVNRQSLLDLEINSSYFSILLDEFLMVIIWLLTEMPPPSMQFSSKHRCMSEEMTHGEEEKNSTDPLLSIKNKIRREVVHRLASKLCVFSDFNDWRTMTPFVQWLPPNLVETILSEVAITRNVRPLEPIKYSLKESIWCEYDPSFYHLNRREHQQAHDSKPVTTQPSPIVCRPYPAHPKFAGLRDDIYSVPLLYKIIQRVFQFREAQSSLPFQTLLIRILQILTLGVYFIQNSSSDKMKSNYFLSIHESNADSESIISFTFSLVKQKSVEQQILNGFIWLHKQWAEMDENSKNFFNETLVTQQPNVNDSQQKKIQKARENALKKMKERAENFAATFENNQQNIEITEQTQDRKQEEKETVQCIVCHETNARERCTYLALIQPSSVLNVHRSNQIEPRLHIQSCGHSLHESCYHVFYESMLTSMKATFYLEKDQIDCPLCKKPSNIIIPIVDSPIPEIIQRSNDGNYNTYSIRNDFELWEGFRNWLSNLDVLTAFPPADQIATHYEIDFLPRIIDIFKREIRHLDPENNWTGLLLCCRTMSYSVACLQATSHLNLLTLNERASNQQLHFYSKCLHFFHLLATTAVEQRKFIRQLQLFRIDENHNTQQNDEQKLEQIIVEEKSFEKKNEKKNEKKIQFELIATETVDTMDECLLHQNLFEVFVTAVIISKPTVQNLKMYIIFFNLAKLVQLVCGHYTPELSSIENTDSFTNLLINIIQMLQQELGPKQSKISFTTKFKSCAETVTLIRNDFQAFLESCALLADIWIPNCFNLARLQTNFGGQSIPLETIWDFLELPSLSNFSQFLPFISNLLDDLIGGSSDTNAGIISFLMEPVQLQTNFSYPNSQQIKLISLPKNFAEFYSMLTAEATDNNPAICLICGEICEADGKGLCTAHSKKCANGAGIFLVLKVQEVLLFNSKKACYFSMPYVDAHGEKHIHGRPLYLSQEKYNFLTSLYVNHQIINEVVQTRLGASKVIREGWY